MCLVHRGSLPLEILIGIIQESVKLIIIKGHKLCIVINNMLCYFCGFSFHLYCNQGQKWFLPCNRVTICLDPTQITYSNCEYKVIHSIYSSGKYIILIQCQSIQL